MLEDGNVTAYDLAKSKHAMLNYTILPVQFSRSAPSFRMLAMGGGIVTMRRIRMKDPFE